MICLLIKPQACNQSINSSSQATLLVKYAELWFTALPKAVMYKYFVLTFFPIGFFFQSVAEYYDNIQHMSKEVETKCCFYELKCFTIFGTMNFDGKLNFGCDPNEKNLNSNESFDQKD